MLIINLDCSQQVKMSGKYLSRLACRAPHGVSLVCDKFVSFGMKNWEGRSGVVGGQEIFFIQRVQMVD